MRIIRDFFSGLSAHASGLRFAFSHWGYMPLVLIPFLLTIALYAGAFWAFTTYSEQMLAWLWSPQGTAEGWFMSVLLWLYANVFKYFLYLLVLALMYYLFMVVANIIASPLYDLVARRVRRDEAAARGETLPPPTEISIPRTVVEELKRALFVILLPIPFLLVPVAGPVLAMVVAMICLGWDFIDYSLVLDAPRFGERLRFVRANLFLMLGFGALLLVPLLNFLLYPFAILGGSLAYQRQVHRPEPKADSMTSSAL